jgi:hypothetical protein
MYSKNLTTTPLAAESNLEKLQTDNLALLRSHGLAEYHTFVRKDLGVPQQRIIARAISF